MATAPAREQLVVVDAHSLIYQVFHAVRAPMTSPDGRPTQAVYGFTRDLEFLRDEFRPKYLVVAFDRPGPTFRSAIDPDYKAHRPPPPDDLQLQFPLIRRVVEAMNLPVLEFDEFEADDILATLAVEGPRRDLDVILCTTDKDCRQVLGDNVRMYNLRKREFFDAASLLEDWGIRPDQVIDYQAMVGDPVDNVPGVPGVGAKTAAKLLQQYGTLETILANADAVKPPKVRDSLKASGEVVARCRKLVALSTDVPVGDDWSAWTLREPNAAALLAIYDELGFRGFAQKLRAAGGVKDLFATADDNDFAFGANAPAAAAWVADYRLVDTVEEFNSFLAELKQHPRFAIDLETTDLDPLRCDIVGIAVAWKAGEAYYLPLRGPAECAKLDAVPTLAALKPVLENASVGKVNQNIKYDLLALRRHGIELRGVVGDPMVADYLLRAGERSHNLDDLARRHLNHVNISIEELIGKKGKSQKSMDQVDTAKVCEYAGEDADVAWRLTELLEAELDREGLKSLYDNLEVPLIGVLAELQTNGIRVDVPYLQNLGAEMAEQLAAMEADIFATAGRDFNINSPKQLGVILFDELKLPSRKKTATGDTSTDQETLEQLAAFHPLPRKIVEYRQVAKLKGTYVDALPALVHPETGRIHGSFNQTVAATGRLSSTEPNLQNIPARTEQGRQIRRAFLPRDGWQLLTADYSQIELRLLAHFSGDDNLRRAFAEGKDVHASVASLIFNVAEAAVNSDQRRVAKTVNFGVIYGMSGHGLAARLGIERDAANKFIDEYFARFPAVQEYQAKLLANCVRSGYVTTLQGRRRKIIGVRPRTTFKGLNQPEREAVNMEIQGTAADMMKRAMLAVSRRLICDAMAAKLLLTVHDELVLEVPPDEVTAVAAMARREMIAALQLEVPVEVDVAAGPNWLDVEEVTP